MVKAEVVLNDVQCDASLTRATLTDILVVAVANVAQVLPSRVAVNITSGCDDVSRARRLQGSVVTASVEISGNDNMGTATSTAASLEANVEDGSLVTEMRAVAPPAAAQRLSRAQATAQVEVEQPPTQQDEVVVDEGTVSSDQGASGAGTVVALVIVGTIVMLLVSAALYRFVCHKKRRLARSIKSSSTDATEQHL